MHPLNEIKTFLAMICHQAKKDKTTAGITVFVLDFASISIFSLYSSGF